MEQRILIAEDDPHIRELLALRLEMAALSENVTFAHDGDEAVAEIKNSVQPYDIVVTDYHMPGKDGVEVAREALKARIGKVIIFTDDFEKVQRKVNELSEKEANFPKHIRVMGKIYQDLIKVLKG